jgi:uncharacterized protein (DUF488 family)
MLVQTIGHSTRTAGELCELLLGHAVARLVDIRTIPRSRKNPQFNRDVLPQTLAEVGLAYVHVPALGGLRKPRSDSPNAGWHNDSFRGYADYMQTDEFVRALESLVALAAQGSLALMCAEAVPWRCHRSLVADALTVRGVEVRHVLGPGEAQPHRMTSFAHVEGARVTYPPPPA